jgi:CRP/FNR family transcriptional regulator, cyclic AMP receptor protein
MAQTTIPVFRGKMTTCQGFDASRCGPSVATIGGPAGAISAMMGPVPELRQAMSSVWFFSALEASTFDHLARLAQPRQVRAKHEIVRKGDPADEFFVMLRGKAKVTARGTGGTDTGFAVMGRGDVFGETALLDGGTRSATVTAIEDCDLVVLKREGFLWLLKQHPEISLHLLAVMAARLRALSERVEERAFLSVKARLAQQLVSLTGRYGSAQQNSAELNLSQEELGALAGAGRESVNKQLRDWTRQGLLSQGRGKILIRDVAALRAVAEVER